VAGEDEEQKERKMRIILAVAVLVAAGAWAAHSQPQGGGRGLEYNRQQVYEIRCEAGVRCWSQDNVLHVEADR
jgi:hypothetical protein